MTIDIDATYLTVPSQFKSELSELRTGFVNSIRNEYIKTVSILYPQYTKIASKLVLVSYEPTTGIYHIGIRKPSYYKSDKLIMLVTNIWIDEYGSATSRTQALPSLLAYVNKAKLEIYNKWKSYLEGVGAYGIYSEETYN